MHKDAVVLVLHQSAIAVIMPTQNECTNVCLDVGYEYP